MSLLSGDQGLLEILKSLLILWEFYKQIFIIFTPIPPHNYNPRSIYLFLPLAILFSILFL